MNRLAAAALHQTQQMRQGTSNCPDDDVFLVVRGEGACLMELDPTIHNSTNEPQMLLRNDGTIVTQIVESVRPQGRITPAQNAAFNEGTWLLIHYEMVASKDKDFVLIKEATHGITPCTACEKTPEQHSNVTKNQADDDQRWVNTRF